jgi:chromosome segregation ATPase
MGLETGPAENSIAALEAKISDFKKKYLNGTLVITPEVYDEQIKAMEKELQDKKITMKVIVDPTVEKVKELNTSYTNIQRTEKKSSFQTAVESVTPAPSTESGTNEERLAALQKEMDFNDQLIEQLEKLRDEYAKLGDAGAEGFQKVNDEIGKLNEKQTEYAEETKEVEKADKKVKKQAKTFQAVGDAVGNVGNALSALGEAAESPELNVAGIIAQAIANVMLGYASASTQAADMGPWAWIAFAASGLAIALSTVS